MRKRSRLTTGVIGILALAAAACTPPAKEPIAPAAAESETVAAPAPAAAPAVAAVPAALKTCAGVSAPAADGLVDDFEDGNNGSAQLAGRGGYWFTASDNGGSTILPRGEFVPSDGGAGGSKKAGKVSGKTAPEPPAWGAVFGVSMLPDNRSYDASRYSGVSFWAKVGPQSATKFRLKVSDVNTHPAGRICKDEPGGCWNHFGADLTLGTEWKEYKVSFAELKQEDGWGSPRPPALTANQLISFDWTVPRGQEFELWIDEVQLLDCP